MEGPSVLEDVDYASIGERLRAARERSGYTLDELSGLTGFSKAHLSRLESAARQPSIGALLTCARALGVPVSRLLGEDGSPAPIAIHDGAESSHEVAGLEIAAVSGFNGSSILEALRMRITADRPPSEPAQHRGEEWLYVVSGTLGLEYDGEQYVVDAGACAHLAAERPHRLCAIGPEVEVLVVAADGWRALRGTHR